MRTPVPSLPSPLPEFEVTAAPRRGLPVVVLAHAGDSPLLGPGGADLGAHWAEAVGLTGKAGEVHTAATQGAGIRWVAGIGEGSAAEWRKAGASLVRAFESRAAAERRRRPPGRAVPAAHAPARRGARAHRGTRAGREPGRVPLRGDRQAGQTPAEVAATRDFVAGLVRPAVERAAAFAAGTAATRDMGNAPSNVKDPAWLARQP